MIILTASSAATWLDVQQSMSVHIHTFVNAILNTSVTITYSRMVHLSARQRTQTPIGDDRWTGVWYPIINRLWICRLLLLMALKRKYFNLQFGRNSHHWLPLSLQRMMEISTKLQQTKTFNLCIFDQHFLDAMLMVCVFALLIYTKINALYG